MQIVLEFMDKGMKGMLTGDLSAYAIKQILMSIEKFLPKIERVQKEIENVLEFINRNEAGLTSANEFFENNFMINR